jgi:uncharacterized protein YcaQ
MADTVTSSLSIGAARHIALAAQGFPQSTPLATCADVKRAVEALGVVQIDSVNVLVRSHYLPLFSRYGAYARDLLDGAAYSGELRGLFEYWGHEASLLPIEFYPLFHWRMEEAQQGKGIWSGIARFGRERPDFIATVLDQIREQGPLGVSGLEQSGKRSGSWWGWSEGKRALEWLFWTGVITTVTRKKFERVYDLAERAIPHQWFSAPTPAPDEAQRALLETAARALGVATASDLADYFRINITAAKLRIQELVDADLLRPVRVDGWKALAYMHRSVRDVPNVTAQALLSPFDSLVWERARTERLFNFHYRIEIYTPQHKRKHGYYVLPFLFNNELVARVDLKSDRASQILRVIAVHAEHERATDDAAAALAQDLKKLAEWLGLQKVALGRRGNFSKALRPHLSVRHLR